MPKKEKKYERVFFGPEVIRKADRTLRGLLKEEATNTPYCILDVDVSNEERWSHDNEEEFFADYRKNFNYAVFLKTYAKAEVRVATDRTNTSVSVEMPNRPDMEKVFDVFEANVEKCRLPAPHPKEKPKLRVFIGHGRNRQWRDLKDHLHEMHGYDVEAYEIGARAGLTIQEVLEKMLASSSLALLVLTGEDKDAKGGLHARENVIHELGLFQGGLGWKRAIALFEEGVEEFSNIHGVDQIPFKKGRIQETFGEVLATIKREFPGNI